MSNVLLGISLGFLHAERERGRKGEGGRGEGGRGEGEREKVRG